ncbi:DMT family transporter [Sporolactobacillus shoreicorticis]|uniref:DMT family transporter n=1 Tax=Sporolactobacillus shoreicorticis TaxID=1923877 RepID=A0ABW5S1X9_9BACL|nr:DMT family transporter [Sporolactobacillus shoreicorticis]MCO7125326.1 DMT family transporter [Sporolactobacillus shoreicorticis]
MERLRGMVYFLVAFALAGTSVISAQLLNEKLGTFTITSVSLLIALFCLLPLCWKKVIATLGRLSAGEWLLLCVQAVFGVFLFRFFLLTGLLYTSAGEAGLLTGATPALTVLIARILLKERVHKGKMIGIFCTVVGILLIQGVLIPGEKFSMDHMLGNLLVLLAMFSESLFNTFSRTTAVRTQSSERSSIHPMVQTTIVSAVACVLCLIPSLFESPWTSLLVIGWKEWMALVWYGLFVTVIAFIFWYAGIKRCQASTAAAFSGVMPFTALLLSVVVLGEHASWEQWVGGAVVILGMVLISRRTAV